MLRSTILAAVCVFGIVPATSLAAAPQPIVRPTIAGTAQPDTTLSARNGEWKSSTNTAFAYQWRRCDARGRRCATIKGAVGRVWDVFGEDRGRTFRVAVTARNQTASRTAVTRPSRVVRSIAGGAVQGVTVAAVGDIACSPAENIVTPTTCQQGSTASVVQRSGAAATLVLGDVQYQCGDPEEFSVFDGTWGPLKPGIRPVPGNHEYQNKGGLGDPGRCSGSPSAPGTGYFGYFGPAAGAEGAGYYSFDLGAWHLVALNANCPFVACAKGSPQEQWLRADLAATKQPCVLAYWHQPRFAAAGRPANPGSDTGAFWDDLQAARADVVLNGHVHAYERFAPMTAAGVRKSTGLRQFTVGTGGDDFQNTVVDPQTNAEVRWSRSFGALALKLGAGRYSWQFLSTDGGFTDRGSDTCQS